MKQKIFRVAVLVVIVWADAAAFGQATAPSGTLCFRARPAAYCRSFLAIDFGVRYVPSRSGSGTGFSDRLLVPMSIGWMKNEGSRSAFGFSIGLEPDVQYSDWRLAFGPRYRFWITDRASADAAVDFAVTGEGVRTVTLHGVWMYGEVFGVDAGVVLDRVDDGYDRKSVAPFLGIRLGSYAGATTIAGTSLLYALFAVAYSGD